MKLFAITTLTTLLINVSICINTSYGIQEPLEIQALAIQKLKKVVAIQQTIVSTLQKNLNKGIVGEVRASLLSLQAFQNLNGNDWVLMDGQTALPVDNPLRQLTGLTQVPDARGRFLRMKDYGANVDSSGDKPVGTLLDDLTKMPNNQFSGSTDRNTHDHLVNIFVAGGSGVHYKGAWSSTSDHGGPFPTTTSPHSHSHSVSVSGGDAETRPKNIIVSYYIKIR
ncbi:MAG: hypothetical protein HQK53_07170 [Oligoflexia bacterium]|nr:hypothetical protein [Oligoflexia bacterium]